MWVLCLFQAAAAAGGWGSDLYVGRVASVAPRRASVSPTGQVQLYGSGESLLSMSWSMEVSASGLAAMEADPDTALTVIKTAIASSLTCNPGHVAVTTDPPLEHSPPVGGTAEAVYDSPESSFAERGRTAKELRSAGWRRNRAETSTFNLMIEVETENGEKGEEEMEGKIKTIDAEGVGIDIERELKASGMDIDIFSTVVTDSKTEMSSNMGDKISEREKEVEWEMHHPPKFTASDPTTQILIVFILAMAGISYFAFQKMKGMSTGDEEFEEECEEEYEEEAEEEE